MTIVHKLSGDILYHIFAMNTLSDADFSRSQSSSAIITKSLNTARYTSQVCTLWRHLILSSTFIWANSLDTNHVKQWNSPRWLQEVMNRTGTSPLSVIHSETSLGIQSSFFVSFLIQNWHRIRRISLTLFCLKNPEYEKLWEAFYRESPGLEIFTYSHLGHIESYRDPSRILFADVSPFLRQFSVEKVPFSRFSILSHMTILQLSASAIGKEFLSALSHMNSLESLVIKNPNITFQLSPRDILPDQWSTIQLPALRSIKLQVSLQHLLWLMYRIEAGAERIVEIDVAHDNERTEQFHLSDIQRCLLTHLHAAFEGQKTAYLSISQYNVHLATSPGYLNAPPHPSIRLHNERLDSAIWDALVGVLLQVMNHINLSSVTMLELGIISTGAWLSIPSLSSLFAGSFLGVTIINRVTADILVLLQKAQDHLSKTLLFPGLKELHLILARGTIVTSDDIIRFLKQRMELQNVHVSRLTARTAAKSQSDLVRSVLLVDGIDYMEEIWRSLGH